MNSKRFDDFDWKTMAGWLTANGYKREDRPDTIMQAIFVGPGGAVYLYRPDLGKEYTIEIAETPKPADLVNKIVYLPAYYTDVKEKYLWAIRPLSTKPKLFTMASAAEHLGVSVAWLKAEAYEYGRLKLIDGHNKFGDRILFPESDLVEWDKNRNGIGAPRTRRPRKPKVQPVELAAIPA